MRLFLHLTFLLLLTVPAFPQAPEVQRFRQWVAGQELGGAESRTTFEGAATRIERREWINFTRLGIEIQQEIKETSVRNADGSLHFTWRTQISKEPLEGEADWSPSRPRELRVKSNGFEAKVIPMRTGALLWPRDVDGRMREAARLRKPVKISSYSFTTQQWTQLDLNPVGPSPLPGFPDAVLFKGLEIDGATRAETSVWVSPTRGDLKHTGEMMGLSLVLQLAELPDPIGSSKGKEAFFEQSLKTIPQHPFQPWLTEVRLRWQGAKPLQLPEDPQQHQVKPNLFALTSSAPLKAEEAKELPVRGKPSKEDAPFLAATPIVPFNDPAFDGLVFRMRAPKGASRWVLAQLVTDFVWEWIAQKDYTVGFASALEVCRNPRGDCTEHGVLAVALLRKLGVPARGVVGWMAAGENLGLHFWVEVKLGRRWVPVDPTFDQAPASAFRLKLGTTDLADLGSVGWDNAGQIFGGGTWKVEKPDGLGDLRLEAGGEILHAPGGTRLRAAGSTWSLGAGLVLHREGGDLNISAVPRPYPESLEGAKRLQSGRWSGWWQPKEQKLFVDLGDRRWLGVEPLNEHGSAAFMDSLVVEGPGR
ncbi:MAG: transglutaminase domain-containing protein [Holophagaceae bacterium]|nr:transglutaminase domain-containing protein [Holophagaceae bacterium]